MVLYTTEPYELIFGCETKPPETRMEQTPFGKLEINALTGTISRIISTDPRAYLDTGINPGSVFMKNRSGQR
ncbi:MAG TPA: hypothetical protein DEQ02_00135 [Ruminococcaceae bacterium]|nr:hypothetical protein [Oscillospiraceae bacterium]